MVSLAIIIILTVIRFSAFGIPKSSRQRHKPSASGPGRAAKFNQFPFVGWIECSAPFIRCCSVYVMDVNWVLTSARCFLTNEGQKNPNTDNITLVFGVLNELNNSSPTRQERTSVNVIVHPDYFTNTLPSDVALVQLNESLQVTKSVKPVPLPGEKWKGISKGGVRIDCEVVTAQMKHSPNHKRHSYQVIFERSSVRHGPNSCPCIVNEKVGRGIICVPNLSTSGLCSPNLSPAVVCDGKLQGLGSRVMECRECDLHRTEADCSTITVFNAYTYLCPLTKWIGKYVPNVKGMTMEKCDPQFSLSASSGATSSTSGGHLFLLLLWLSSVLARQSFITLA